MPRGKSRITADLEVTPGAVEPSRRREDIVKKVICKKPLIVTNLQDAKILISRIVYQLQTGDVDISLAKAILYGTSCYIQCVKEADIEDRIKQLEDKIGVNGYE